MVKRAWNRRVIYWLAGSAVVAALFVFRTAPSAQSGYVHLNPVVEALSQGRHVFGVSTSDFSIENAVALAGNPNLDYVYLDMEHNPLRFQEMKHFLAFITAGDKAGLIKRGNGQVRPAVFARFPPYGREQTLWIVKHALDVGLNGILINNIETRDQAENMYGRCGRRSAEIRGSRIRPACVAPSCVVSGPPPATSAAAARISGRSTRKAI